MQVPLRPGQSGGSTSLDKAPKGDKGGGKEGIQTSSKSRGRVLPRRAADAATRCSNTANQSLINRTGLWTDSSSVLLNTRSRTGNENQDGLHVLSWRSRPN